MGVARRTQVRRRSDPHYLGNAVGHWDGDTLVIESTGFKDSAEGLFWLDDNANPQSSQARVVERWSRPDFHHPRPRAHAYTDPVYYTKPVRYTRHWVAGAPGETLQEFSCEWNTPWVVNHLEPGPGLIRPDGNRGFGPNGQVVPDVPLGSVTDASARHRLLALSQEQAEAVRPAGGQLNAVSNIRGSHGEDSSCGGSSLC